MGGTEFVAIFRERIEAGAGDTILVNPDPNLRHLFDGVTGERGPRMKCTRHRCQVASKPWRPRLDTFMASSASRMTSLTSRSPRR
jgi:hypothetical protein